MPGQILKNLRVFVAAPGDLLDVRNAVNEVCDELNPLLKTQNKRLDVLDWRSVTFYVGTAPEPTILSQLNPDDWDIFIGIFWHRFGTPTGGINSATGKSYDSGTEEEFFTATQELIKRDLPILFYRCDTPIKPSQIDPDQLNLVKKFFKEFEQGGSQLGYIYDFDTPDQFKGYLRRDLSKTAQRF